jgi:hypothetical protein
MTAAAAQAAGNNSSKDTMNSGRNDVCGERQSPFRKTPLLSNGFEDSPPLQTAVHRVSSSLPCCQPLSVCLSLVYPRVCDFLTCYG